MLKIILLALTFSLSSYALKVTEVYKIVGINEKESNKSWTGLNTLTGSVVFLRCATADFDDVVRDRVGGFKTVKDCLDFVDIVKKHASEKNPVLATIGNDFILEITVSY